MTSCSSWAGLSLQFSLANFSKLHLSAPRTRFRATLEISLSITRLERSTRFRQRSQLLRSVRETAARRETFPALTSRREPFQMQVCRTKSIRRMVEAHQGHTNRSSMSRSKKRSNSNAMPKPCLSGLRPTEPRKRSKRLRQLVLLNCQTLPKLNVT